MVEKKEVPIKLPKTLAAVADRLYIVKNERLALQKEFEKKIEALKKEEMVLTDHLINTLPKGEASGIAGKVARASITTKPIPRVEDWNAFWASFKPSRDRDLLQKRLSDTAVKERWDAGKVVPGVSVFNVVSVSLNKL